MKSHMRWLPVGLILLAGILFTGYTKQYTVSQSEIMTEAEPESAAYARLRELDKQITKNHENDKNATANSRRASAESERKLWQAEVDRMLDMLHKQLPQDAWEELAAGQNQWYLSRGEQASASARKAEGSAIEELERQISLAESTRERAYQLAEAYEEALTAYEEALQNETEPEQETG